MRRGEKKMKYWGFYTSGELKAQTIDCAKTANETDSEYIRKAVQMRNNIPHITEEELNKVFNPDYKPLKTTDVEQIVNKAITITGTIADGTEVQEKITFDGEKPVYSTNNFVPDKLNKALSQPPIKMVKPLTKGGK